MRASNCILVAHVIGLVLFSQASSVEAGTSVFIPTQNAKRTSLGIFNPTTGKLVRTLQNRETGGPGEDGFYWGGLDFRGRLVDA